VKNRSLRERVGFAIAGWKAAWMRERSFRTQSWFAALAVLLLVVTRAAPIWWAVFAIVCALILALELINSALEALIDLLHPAIHPEIKVIKDMLAGAVLIVSCAALIVGVALIFAYCRAFLESLQT
jgi:undecaprenol kinase